MAKTAQVVFSIKYFYTAKIIIIKYKLWILIGVKICAVPATQRWRERGGEISKQPMNRTQRSEVNFPPDNPAGQTDETLETKRKVLQEEMKKLNLSLAFKSSRMEVTLPLWRKEIYNGARIN